MGLSGGRASLSRRSARARVQVGLCLENSKEALCTGQSLRVVPKLSPRSDWVGLRTEGLVDLCKDLSLSEAEGFEKRSGLI